MTPDVTVEIVDDSRYQVTVRHAAVFSNWLALRNQLTSLSARELVVLDLSTTCLVDHTVMEKLHELGREFEQQNRRLIVTGLDDHHSTSNHPHAARRKLAGERFPHQNRRPLQHEITEG